MKQITRLPWIAASDSPDTRLYLPAAAMDLFALICDDPRQQRAGMTLHPTLCRVAQAHAQDMAERNFFGHVNPDGHGPNWRVRRAGYALPYLDADGTANNVESIAAGDPTAQGTFNAWLHSPSHIVHVLGLDPFYAAQANIGVGYFLLPDGKSKFWRYWVFLSAPPQEA